MITPDTVAYLVTWANEISSRMTRVRNMIGSAHWPSDGSYKEHLLREILQRHLPGHLSTQRGFIRDILSPQTCSPEVDILITDPTIHVPMFNEGQLQIAVPSAVLATVEVKSSYSSAILRDSLDNVRRVRQFSLSTREGAEVWSSVVFTDSNGSVTAGSLLDDIERSLPPDWTPNGLPQCVAVANSALALLTVNASAIDIRVFECQVVALSFALAYIFSHVQSTLRRTQSSGELDELLRNIDYDGPQSRRTISAPKGSA